MKVFIKMKGIVSRDLDRLVMSVSVGGAEWRMEDEATGWHKTAVNIK